MVPALQALGRTDVAVVSFGDFPLADALSPALTVVDQNPSAVGEVAATRLFERMDHPRRRLRRRIVLPVTLVTRASSVYRPRRSDDPLAGRCRSGGSTG